MPLNQIKTGELIAQRNTLCVVLAKLDSLQSGLAAIHVQTAIDALDAQLRQSAEAANELVEGQ